MVPNPGIQVKLSAALMKSITLLALFVVLTFGVLASAAQTLEQDLEKNYVGKVLILRHPVDKNSQKYDWKGTLLSGGSEGPWTRYGGLEISSMHLYPDKLFIEGSRLEYAYEGQQKGLVPRKESKQKMEVEIQLEKPIATAEEADAAIRRVFTLNEEDLLQTVPPFWRPYLRKQMSSKQSARDRAPSPEAASAADEFESMRLQGVTRMDLKLLQAPKALHTPAPEVPAHVRRLPADGVVVLDVVIDTTGRVLWPVVIRPLGLGYDEAAIAAVTGWKFKPAMKDGKPVATEMAFEIAFNGLN